MFSIHLTIPSTRLFLFPILRHDDLIVRDLERPRCSLNTFSYACSSSANAGFWHVWSWRPFTISFPPRYQCPREVEQIDRYRGRSRLSYDLRVYLRIHVRPDLLPDRMRGQHTRHSRRHHFRWQRLQRRYGGRIRSGHGGRWSRWICGVRGD